MPLPKELTDKLPPKRQLNVVDEVSASLSSRAQSQEFVFFFEGLIASHIMATLKRDPTPGEIEREVRQIEVPMVKYARAHVATELNLLPSDLWKNQKITAAEQLTALLGHEQCSALLIQLKKQAALGLKEVLKEEITGMHTLS